MRRMSKKHHRERGFESALQKPFTGRGVLNRLGLNTISQFKKSSFDQALWNASKQLWKHRFGHIFWSRQDIRIFGLQLLKTYVFLFIRSKNPHRQRGFEHTYIHTIHTCLRLVCLTGRGVWAQISESYVAVEMQKPSQGEGFRSAHVTKVADC